MKTVIALLIGAAVSARLHAQARGGEWTTTAGDAQRTAWVRADARLSREAVQEGQFRFLWKMKLDNQARQLESLTQPVLLSNIISYKGFKALAFIGGSADTVYSLDYDLARIFWTARLNTWPVKNSTVACPGALTTVTRATPLGQTGTAPGPGGGGRGANNNVYVIASDGEAHTLNPQTGDDLVQPVKFLPPNAKAMGAILIDPILYASTADNCGGASNGVWSVDLGHPAKTVSTWETKGGRVAGTAGPVFGTDGALYVATADGEYSDSTYSNAVVALDPKTLAVKNWFTPGRTPFTTSPIAFEHGGKHLIAAGNRDGRLYLLDSASFGGSDHKTPLDKPAPYASVLGDFNAGALATFADPDGTRWILAATGGPVHGDTKFPAANGQVINGAIVAYKVVEQNGGPVLQAAWVSRDMAGPVPPIVVNGVVFALASGEYRTTDSQMTAAQRAKQSKPAVLYALDAATGRELWNSGTTITSFVHAIAPSAGDGQVYVVTHDGVVYAFGIPLEH